MASSITIVPDPARLTATEERALAKADAEMAKAKTRGAKQIARGKIDAVARRRQQRVTLSQRSADLRETVSLAIGRGEEVDQSGPQTRILTRQGIQQAFEDGHMAPAHGSMTADHLHATAKIYRDAFEIAAGLAGGSGEGGGGCGAKGPQIKLVEAGEALALMRDGLSQRQIDVLDRVCGHDMRLRETATILRRGFPSTKNSLVSGLTAATLSLKAARAVRQAGEPTTRDRLEIARAQIEQATRMAG